MAKPWRICLHGSIRLHGAGKDCASFETQRSAKLLALLSLSRTGTMRREDLADLLWPEDYYEATRLRLRQELTRLRRALGDAAGIVTADALFVSLDRSQVETDLDVIDRLTSGPLPEVLELEREVAAMDAEFLSGWDDPWVVAERAPAEASYVGLCLKAAETLLEANRPETALAAAQSAIRRDPCHEPARLLAIRAHGALGCLADAVAEFQSLRRAMRESFNREPTLKADDLLVASVTAPIQPRHGFRLPPVPIPIDRFYGREDLLGTAVDRVSRTGADRLVSLVGPGGIGKSRLAVEIGRQLATADDVQVGFIPFLECPSDVSAGAFLLESVTGSQGVTDDPIAAIVRQLAGQPSVLILDNLEHAHDGPELVSQLLTKAPDLRILVTSRKALRIGGEFVLTLGPLDLETAAKPMLQDLWQQARNRDIPAGDEKAVQSLLRHLDGVPLAIRLAAARLRFLSAGELLEELLEEGGNLRAESPDLPDRHRDLLALVKSSMDGLPDVDQLAIQGLAAYPGGFTRRQAKERIGKETTDSLERLLDASLLVLEDDGPSIRFRILEPIRHLIRFGMANDDRLEADRQFVDHMTRAAATLPAAWDFITEEHRNQYRADAVNLRVALTEAVSNRPTLAAEMVSRLWMFELAAGRSRELERHIVSLLSDGSIASACLIGHLWLARVWCASDRGDIDAAREFAQKAIASFKNDKAEPGYWYARLSLVENERHLIDFSVSEKAYQEIIDRAFQDWPCLAATARAWRGMIYALSQSWERAEQDLVPAAAVFQRGGDDSGVITANIPLMQVEYAAGRMDKVHRLLEETRELVERLGDQNFVSIYCRSAARFAIVDEEYERAEAFARRALKDFAYAGNALHDCEIKISLAQALVGRGQLSEARQVASDALTTAIPLNFHRVVTMAMAVLAEASRQEEEPKEAAEWLALALGHAQDEKVRIVIMDQAYVDRLVRHVGDVAPVSASASELLARVRSVV